MLKRLFCGKTLYRSDWGKVLMSSNGFVINSSIDGSIQMKFWAQWFRKFQWVSCVMQHENFKRKGMFVKGKIMQVLLDGKPGAETCPQWGDMVQFKLLMFWLIFSIWSVRTSWWRTWTSGAMEVSGDWDGWWFRMTWWLRCSTESDWVMQCYASMHQTFEDSFIVDHDVLLWLVVSFDNQVVNLSVSKQRYLPSAGYGSVILDDCNFHECVDLQVASPGLSLKGLKSKACRFPSNWIEIPLLPVHHAQFLKTRFLSLLHAWATSKHPSTITHRR